MFVTVPVSRTLNAGGRPLPLLTPIVLQVINRVIFSVCFRRLLNLLCTEDPPQRQPRVTLILPSASLSAPPFLPSLPCPRLMLQNSLSKFESNVITNLIMC